MAKQSTHPFFQTVTNLSALSWNNQKMDNHSENILLNTLVILDGMFWPYTCTWPELFHTLPHMLVTEDTNLSWDLSGSFAVPHFVSQKLHRFVALVAGFVTDVAGTGSGFSSPSLLDLFLYQSLTLLMMLSLFLSCPSLSGLPLEPGGLCTKAAHTVLCYLEMPQMHVMARMVVMLDQEMLQVVFNHFTTKVLNPKSEWLWKVC